MANVRLSVHGGQYIPETRASRHAVVYTMNKNKIIVITVSGRGEDIYE
ncbi:MAG: hypothetical protein IJ035_05890 [Oscillospiraceae bacterium]|nr:hypothetical protein [Oscillospiraceae bacterium]